MPAWARIGDNTVLPVGKIGDRSIATEKYAVDSVDHNALKDGAVRRAALGDEAADASKLAPAVIARFLPSPIGEDDGRTLTITNEAWATAAPPPTAVGGKPHWYEMGQRSPAALATGTSADLTLRPDGLTVFADAAAVRTAIGDGTISMVALQRSDTDAQAFGAVAPNFISSAAANYAMQFRYPTNGQEITVRFTPTAITVTPSFEMASNVRLDLGVFT